jgi:hypothetical protein
VRYALPRSAAVLDRDVEALGTVLLLYYLAKAAAVAIRPLESARIRPAGRSTSALGGTLVTTRTWAAGGSPRMHAPLGCCTGDAPTPLCSL